MNFDKSPVEPEIEDKTPQIIESAQKGRFQLAIDVSERIFSHVLDLTCIGNWKMLLEIINGKTLAGQKLSSKDRMVYVMIITTSLSCYSLTAYGISNKDNEALKLALLAYTSSSFLTAIEKSSQMIRDTKQLAEKYKIESLIKFILAFEKIINKIKNKKLNDNK